MNYKKKEEIKSKIIHFSKNSFNNKDYKPNSQNLLQNYSHKILSPNTELLKKETKKKFVLKNNIKNYTTKKVNIGDLKFYKKRIVKAKSETSISINIVTDMLNKANWNERIIPNKELNFQFSPFNKKDNAIDINENKTILIEEHSQLEIPADYKRFSFTPCKPSIGKIISFNDNNFDKKDINTQNDIDNNDKENILQINNYVLFNNFSSQSTNDKKLNKHNNYHDLKKSQSAFKINKRKNLNFLNNYNKCYEYEKDKGKEKEEITKDDKNDNTGCYDNNNNKLCFSTQLPKGNNNLNLIIMKNKKFIFMPTFLKYSQGYEKSDNKRYSEKILYKYKDSNLYNNFFLPSHKRLSARIEEKIKHKKFHSAKKEKGSSIIRPPNELYQEMPLRFQKFF